jgi:hypothetical protein
MMQRRLPNSRVGMQRCRRYVCYEVFVEAASLAGKVRRRRGELRGVRADASNPGPYCASLKVEVRFPHVVSCCEGRMARIRR